MQEAASFVYGDCFFVFTCDMCILGAWLATVIGEAFAVLIMTSHFFRRHNTLRLDLPLAPVLFSRKIVEVVFSAFLIDVAMGVLTVLFNRQILKYLGTDELAVYAIQSLLRPKDPASCGRK